MQEDFLHWLARETPTDWWHDSADPDELAAGLDRGASGVTTNPVLAAAALSARPECWRGLVGGLPGDLGGDARAEALMRAVVTRTARAVEPIFEAAAGGPAGRVCGQVNPFICSDDEGMVEMARRYRSWAPNVVVKLPVTAAGLRAMEECVAEGMSVAGTVSFTVPQVIAVAESYRKGAARARAAGISPGVCLAVIMAGRLDGYLTEVAYDTRAAVVESDLRQAAIAVAKRACEIYKDRGHEATLLIAAMRGPHHAVELAGAKAIFSIHPSVQAMLLQPDTPREIRIDRPVAQDVLARLRSVPEFVKAYEPDGMSVDQFVTFGVTQRTLSQFCESGWARLAKL